MVYPCRARRAFTLLELLIVVGIIAIMISILVPAGSRLREGSRRAQCLSNLRTLSVAALAYSLDDPDGVLIYKVHGASEDDLRPLYPKYLQNLNAAVCPSTDNVVNHVNHLQNNSDSARDARGGHSYESRAWIWENRIWPDGRVDRPWGSVPVTSPVRSKRVRGISDPSRVLLMMDADDVQSGVAGDQNNWPDSMDNHGVHGFNVGFMDGHAEWAPRGRPLLQAFINGYYDPNWTDAQYQQYGLRRTTEGSYVRFTWLY